MCSLYFLKFDLRDWILVRDKDIMVAVDFVRLIIVAAHIVLIAVTMPIVAAAFAFKIVGWL